MLTKEQKLQIEQENQRITENIERIKHRIVVFSGKGGVGKTTVSVNIAQALQIKDWQTGILDADITGPNVPKMMGISDQLHNSNHQIIPREKDGVKVVSMASLLLPEQAVIWRGPMRSKVLNQFLGDVAWGTLDYLVADLPPGTGDEILTMTQKMQPDLAIIVTTPQEVSLVDSRRAITMAQKMEIEKIAVVENMSGLICPDCGHRIDLFGSGGGKRQAGEMSIPFLGSIPMDVEARKLADEGRSVIIEKRQSVIAESIFSIAAGIENMLNS